MSHRRGASRALTLTLDMFKPRAGTSPRALADALTSAGVIEKPSWYDASVNSSAPRAFVPASRKPAAIVFETDALVRGFYKRNPSAALEAIDCVSEDAMPTRAKRYADRQLEVMRTKRMNEREARAVVDAEREAELRRFAAAVREGAPLDDRERVLTSPGEEGDGTYANEIERVQAAEEERWRERMESARRAVGEDVDLSRRIRTPRPRR